MDIVIDPFSSKSIERALKETIAYKNWVIEKEKELLNKLGQYGAKKIELGFKYSLFFEDSIETADISVNYRLQDDTVIIEANGEQICFIEFGAGALMGNGYLGKKPEGIVGIGEYGKGKGKNKQGWYYKGKDGNVHHTTGNPPNMPMYKTLKELAEIIIPMAREVFKHD